MEYLILIVGSIACAVLAMRATRLLTAALWLAGVSVGTALILYLIGAREVAVIELSVGAGLVTILFVFAISIAGEDAMQSPSLIPHSLAALLMIAVLCLLGLLMLPGAEKPPVAAVTETPFATTFWQDRALDVFGQLALIFAGVLAMLGLLAETKSTTTPPSAATESEPETVPSDSDWGIEDEPLPEKELV